MVQPVGQGAGLEAAADPWLELGQLGRGSGPGTYHLAVVSAGTMLGASPPWVTMPWIRSLGRMCWRSRPMAVWAMVMASAALMPCSG